MRLIITSLCVCFLIACNNSNATNEPIITDLSTLHLADSIKVEDPLNTQYFTVEVMGTKAANVFDIKASNGYLNGSGKMVMPRKSKGLIPVLYRSVQPLTFIVGFKIPGSDSVYDYFEVSAEQKNIEMNYMKAYQF